jgi:PKD repeat protein
MVKVGSVLALGILILGSLVGCGTQSQQPTVTPRPCQANFTAKPITGAGATVVHFTDKSKGNMTAWACDFNNDGVIDSTIQNPTHVYTSDGNYTITLTITTPDCQDKLTKQDYIRITRCHT